MGNSNAQSGCIFSLPGVGGVFDLTEVAMMQFEAVSAHGTYSYDFVVCGSVSSCNGFSNSSVCQRWINGAANCGVWNAQEPQVIPIPAPGGNGIGLVVSNGEEVRPLRLSTLPNRLIMS